MDYKKLPNSENIFAIQSAVCVCVCVSPQLVCIHFFKAVEDLLRAEPAV